MTIYATGNPVGSTNPKDLIDNAQNIDYWAIGPLFSYPDRRGVNRLSLAGIEASFAAAQAQRTADFNAAQANKHAVFDASQAQREAVFNQYLEGSGWTSLGDYSGGISIVSHSQSVDYAGQPYALKSSVPASISAPYVTTGDWSTESVNFKLVGDNSLRQDASSTTDPEKGAAIIGRGVVSIASVADLQFAPRRSDLIFRAKGMIAGTDYGGGDFKWNSSSEATPEPGITIAVAGVATGRFKRMGITGHILAEWTGVQPGIASSQKAAMEAADAAAKLRNLALVFTGSVKYYFDDVFFKSKTVLGNDTTFLKTSDTSQGFVNWGDKVNGIVDGLFQGFNIDAQTCNNVVNLRTFGNHLRPKYRQLRLLNSDFYAFGVGALTTPGDKTDQVDGLDIDGMYIESTRGNILEGNDYSFGIECFPGVVCRDWRVRNVTTRGKIINKIHSIINLDLDHLDFKATIVFDPKSSGYCELNNCKDLKVGANCTFDSGGTSTYYALLIGGARVVGGQTVTNARMSGNVIGRMAIPSVADIRVTDECRVSMATDVYGTIGTIEFGACKLDALVVPVGSTGSIQSITLNGTIVDRNMRLNVAGYVINELIVNGGVHTLNSTNSRFEAVAVATFVGTIFKLRGAPQIYALSNKTGKLTLNNIYMDGNTNWDRPFFSIDASGPIRVVKSTIENMVSSRLDTSTGQPMALSIGNAINGVMV